MATKEEIEQKEQELSALYMQLEKINSELTKEEKELIEKLSSTGATAIRSSLGSLQDVTAWKANQEAFKNVEEYVYNNTEVFVESGKAGIENRIRNGNYPQKFLNKGLLVDCYGRKMHQLAAKRITMMNKAWVRENPEETNFTLSSGIRPIGELRWRKLLTVSGDTFKMRSKSSNQVTRHPSTNVLEAKKRGERSIKKLFDLRLIDKYGSITEGRKWVSWNSPHESGLAFDLYYKTTTLLGEKVKVHPDSTTSNKQANTKLINWMKSNAHRWGIYPYKKEVWHWEVQLTRKAWYTGEDFVTNGNYDVYIKERSTETGRFTNNINWVGRAFK